MVSKQFRRRESTTERKRDYHSGQNKRTRGYMKISKTIPKHCDALTTYSSTYVSVNMTTV